MTNIKSRIAKGAMRQTKSTIHKKSKNTPTKTNPPMYGIDKFEQNQLTGPKTRK